MSKLLTAEQLGEIRGRHKRDSFMGQYRDDFDEVNNDRQSLIDHIDALQDKVNELETRLELTPKSMGHDGIYARDETIRLQDKRIEELEGVLDRISKLPNEWFLKRSLDHNVTKSCKELSAILEQVKDNDA